MPAIKKGGEQNKRSIPKTAAKVLNQALAEQTPEKEPETLSEKIEKSNTTDKILIQVRESVQKELTNLQKANESLELRLLEATEQLKNFPVLLASKDGEIAALKEQIKSKESIIFGLQGEMMKDKAGTNYAPGETVEIADTATGGANGQKPRSLTKNGIEYVHTIDSFGCARFRLPKAYALSILANSDRYRLSGPSEIESVTGKVREGNYLVDKTFPKYECVSSFKSGNVWTPVAKDE
jgi:hypothetical protein